MFARAISGSGGGGTIDPQIIVERKESGDSVSRTLTLNDVCEIGKTYVIVVSGGRNTTGIHSMTLTGGIELSHGMSYVTRTSYYMSAEIIVFKATSTTISIINDYTTYPNIFGGTLIQLD